MIIAGAGGAAHLPGMTAAHTTLPVLGVPVESAALKGLDSLLSIVQMPAGVPGGDLRHRQGRRDQRRAVRGRRSSPTDDRELARAACGRSATSRRSEVLGETLP